MRAALGPLCLVSPESIVMSKSVWQGGKFTALLQLRLALFHEKNKIFIFFQTQNLTFALIHIITSTVQPYQQVLLEICTSLCSSPLFLNEHHKCYSVRHYDVQSCRITEVNLCGEAVLKCWHKTLPNENMQKGTRSSTMRMVNGSREIATSHSNYTSVCAVVNEGEQCFGIILMGKAPMRIPWTANASSSEFFSRLHVLSAAASVFSNVKGRFFLILEGVHACHPHCQSLNEISRCFGKPLPSVNTQGVQYQSCQLSLSESYHTVNDILSAWQVLK